MLLFCCLSFAIYEHCVKAEGDDESEPHTLRFLKKDTVFDREKMWSSGFSIDL